ncbi:MAG: heparan-alpha-glucosaminide N-acetyltransferase [Pseudomonadota bacterium]
MTAGRRILAIDLARGVALLAMAVFHVGIDLELVGVWPRGSTTTAPWVWAARLIAGSFVFLAGLSLWLAHGHGIRWRGFWRRFALLVAAAAAVSVATYIAVPGAWVRYGILHSIAISSLAGLAFLRLPWAVTAATALGIFAVGPGLVVSAFDGPAWLWLGLGTQVPFMMDYEPFIPWVAPLLLGIAAGRLGTRCGIWDRLSAWPSSPPRAVRWLAWPGQHSLLVYLLHQPILLGLILGGLWLLRP